MVLCALIGQMLSHVIVFQKLKAIEELKEQQASGKVLQKNQVEHLKIRHAEI